MASRSCRIKKLSTLYVGSYKNRYFEVFIKHHGPPYIWGLWILFKQETYLEGLTNENRNMKLQSCLQTGFKCIRIFQKKQTNSSKSKIVSSQKISILSLFKINFTFTHSNSNNPILQFCRFPLLLSLLKK